MKIKEPDLSTSHQREIFLKVLQQGLWHLNQQVYQVSKGYGRDEKNNIAELPTSKYEPTA